jgi:hypothetical protein
VEEADTADQEQPDRFLTHLSNLSEFGRALGQAQTPQVIAYCRYMYFDNFSAAPVLRMRSGPEFLPFYDTEYSGTESEISQLWQVKGKCGTYSILKNMSVFKNVMKSYSFLTNNAYYIYM